MDILISLILRYQLALQGRATRSNKTLMLECSGNGESLGKVSPSAYVEGE